MAAIKTPAKKPEATKPAAKKEEKKPAAAKKEEKKPAAAKPKAAATGEKKKKRDKMPPGKRLIKRLTKAKDMLSKVHKRVVNWDVEGGKNAADAIGDALEKLSDAIGDAGTIPDTFKTGRPRVELEVGDTVCFREKHKEDYSFLGKDQIAEMTVTEFHGKKVELKCPNGKTVIVSRAQVCSVE